MKRTRPTRTNFKSFINKNKDRLYIKLCSKFCSMTDGIERLKDDFRKVEETDWQQTNTLGISGLWLVGSSCDLFTIYDDGEFEGLEWYNCCGSGIIAIKKN